MSTPTDPTSPPTKSPPPGYSLVTEGLASILTPTGISQSVFYNPVQVVNRDLSILVISHYTELMKMEKKEKYEKKVLKLKMKETAEECKDSKTEKREQESVDDNEERDDNIEMLKEESISEAAEFTFQGITLCEGLAATGLRSIRYAKELRNVKRIYANDLLATAVNDIKTHMEFNGVSDNLVTAIQSDACELMFSHRKKEQFDVIDLDPYGSASIFLDPAMQAASEGALLCITCTDMAVLCGSGGEACYAKYGAYPIKGTFCHEQALRILLGCASVHASRHKKYIVPILSLSIDFYVRVFIRVYSSAAITKEAGSKMAYYYQCVGCDYFTEQRLAKVVKKGNSTKYLPGLGSVQSNSCPHCGNSMQIAGPMWAENIHDRPFVEKLIDSLAVVADSEYKPSSDPNVISKVSPLTSNLKPITPILPFHASKRLLALLSLAYEELENYPFYYNLDQLSGTLHLSSPKSIVIKSAIINAGYKISLTHASSNCIKTDAPLSVIWDIYRCYIQVNPLLKVPGVNTPAFKILAVTPQLVANFTECSINSKFSNFAKFLLNPQADWGPKSRASGNASESLKRNNEEMTFEREKALANQGKNSHKKPKTKAYQCKTYVKGQPESCTFGLNCKYIHSDE